MSEATIAVIDRLVAACTALKPLLAEHVDDNFGEVLPHLFLGEVTRHLVKEAAGPAASRGLGPALQLLEDEFASGTDEIKELIAVSFLENLPDGPDPGGDLRLQLGPSLKGELLRMRER
jgi:hypothetical protein